MQGIRVGRKIQDDIESKEKTKTQKEREEREMCSGMLFCFRAQFPGLNSELPQSYSVMCELWQIPLFADISQSQFLLLATQ